MVDSIELNKEIASRFPNNKNITKNEETLIEGSISLIGWGSFSLLFLTKIAIFGFDGLSFLASFFLMSLTFLTLILVVIQSFLVWIERVSLKNQKLASACSIITFATAPLSIWPLVSNHGPLAISVRFEWIMLIVPAFLSYLAFNLCRDNQKIFDPMSYFRAIIFIFGAVFIVYYASDPSKGVIHFYPQIINAYLFNIVPVMCAITLSSALRKRGLIK